MLYNMCTWNEVNTRSLKKLLNSQSSVYRSALGLAIANSSGQHISHNEILYRARRLDMRVVLSVARLR